VVPQWMQRTRPPEHQYFDSTPELYVRLGETLGVSPARIQNFAQNLFSGYGREGLSLTAAARGLVGRFKRTQGGRIEDRAWTAINELDEGYLRARSYAQKAVEKGDRTEARRILMEWNKAVPEKLKDYNETFREYGLQDRGGLRQKYTFNYRKMKNVLLPKRGKDALMERLQ